MKVSIITVTFNSATTVRDTIESVINQDYSDIEYLIIDGCSSDDTLEIVNGYKNRIAKIISEPDEGMYDALNKGISMATGDIVAILNSDDFYTDKSVISAVVSTLEESGADSCYGDLVYVDAADTSKVVRRWKSGEFSKNKFYQGWMPPHPGFFVRKFVYDSLGAFNLNLGSAADYELMLRFLLKNNVSTVYIPRVLVKMRIGGMSNGSIKNRLRANYYDRKAWRVNGISARPWTLFFKPLGKIVQYINK